MPAIESVQITEDGIGTRLAPADGDKILWLHGYTMDSRIWTELWNLLPGWFHIGVDLPGHGLSRHVVEDDLARLAIRIGGLAVEQGVRHIVALSFGTVVALEVAAQMPATFATLTLGGPVFPGGPEDPAIRTRYEELIRKYRRTGLDSHFRAMWMSPSSAIFAGAARHPRLWERMSKIVDAHSWSELDSRANYLFDRRPRLEIHLERVQSASLVLVGENEVLPFRRSAELVRRSLPDCRRVYVPDAGHLCMLEAPAFAADLIASHLGHHPRHGSGDRTPGTSERPHRER
jgi:pimeloyl-ACP methyl ester carboxylesterase